VNLDAFWNLLRRVEREYDADDRLIRDRLQDLRQRLHRADVVTTLPSSAPLGTLLITPGDIHLYIGAGPNLPLRKLPTLPL
jgi:hypothetical protein